MLPDRVSNPGPLTYESGALSIALRGPAIIGALIHYLSRHSKVKAVAGGVILSLHTGSKWAHSSYKCG